MNTFELQAATESVVLQNEAGEAMRKNHDFLSFLSLFVFLVREMSTDLRLLSILLGQAINLQDPISREKLFIVTLVEQEELRREMLIPPENLNPLPNIVNLKASLLWGDPNSPSNKRSDPWRSSFKF